MRLKALLVLAIANIAMSAYAGFLLVRTSWAWVLIVAGWIFAAQIGRWIGGELKKRMEAQ